jgi:S-adenosyl-L-methionine hydrolase (adenosine-forming)
MRPIVALLTDFGGRDHYVGAVKGAVLAACPDATIVDIAHDIPAHDVAEGSFCLGACYHTFPRGSIFVAVIDPGVGSRRRGIAVDAAGYRFVGPDNGIFTAVLARDPGAHMRQLTDSRLHRHDVSATFHARDVFGPVAGFLARGGAFEDVGVEVADPVLLSIGGPPREEDGGWTGEVVHVDRFGNLTTSFRARDLDTALASVGGDPTELVVVVEGMVLPLVGAYADVPEGESCALMGSGELLEVAANCANASTLLGAGRGAPVRLRKAAPER